MINLAKRLLLIYLLLKPFYLFASGGLQIADIFLLGAFAIVCVAAAVSEENRKIFADIAKTHKLFVLFAVCTLIINGLYFIVYPDAKFVLSSLYFIFNLFAIIVFTTFLRDRQFLGQVGTVFKASLILQFLLWLSQLGRYYSPDRYMGTFNDPNQLGYYILLSFFFIFVIDIILSKKMTYVYYVIALFMILQSGSTGMLLGIGVFSIIWAVFIIKKQLEAPYQLVKRVMYSLFAIVVLILPIILMVSLLVDAPRLNGRLATEESTIFSRIDEKSEKAMGDNDISILEDRNLDILTKYPHYMIWGSGEGVLIRFERATYPGTEIHSTFPSMLFYYGLAPFIVVLAWVYSRLRDVRGVVWAVYIALFVTSFILLNQRQALFWVLIAMGPVIAELGHKTIHRRAYADR